MQSGYDDCPCCALVAARQFLARATFEMLSQCHGVAIACDLVAKTAHASSLLGRDGSSPTYYLALARYARWLSLMLPARCSDLVLLAASLEEAGTSREGL